MEQRSKFERSLIRERQKEGIKLAKAKNLYKGRKPSLDKTQVLFFKEQIALGIPKARLSKDFNVSRPIIISTFNLVDSLF
ncbi:MAG: hypothetical protein ACRYE9_02995 [Janthinobacterium lividum]